MKIDLSTLKGMTIITILYITIFLVTFACIGHCDDNSISYQVSSVSLFIKKKNPALPKALRDEIATIIVAESLATNIPYEVVSALACVESHYDPSAVGPCGEIGLMQIYDQTCLGTPIDKSKLHELRYNIVVGICKLIEKLMEVNGDLDKAIMRYNGSGPDTLKFLRKVLDTLTEISIFEIASAKSIEEYELG
jgi:hypothetical protein